MDGSRDGGQRRGFLSFFFFLFCFVLQNVISTFLKKNKENYLILLFLEKLMRSIFL